MEKNFKKDGLSIGINRQDDNKIQINISSEYTRSSHKAQLYVSKKFEEEVLTLWKSISTKKLLSLDVSFSEIDYYDNMTDMYEVPSFHIERGLRKAIIEQNTHGSIPKDWTIGLIATMDDVKTIAPILDVFKETLGSLLNSKNEEKLIAAVRPLIQGNVKNVNFELC